MCNCVAIRFISSNIYDCDDCGDEMAILVSSTSSFSPVPLQPDRGFKPDLKKFNGNLLLKKELKINNLKKNF